MKKEILIFCALASVNFLHADLKNDFDSKSAERSIFNAKNEELGLSSLFRGPTGPTGPIGPKGDRGPTGPAGIQGEKGEKGEKGQKGAVGPIGPKGDKGAKGEKGDKGAVGPAGAIGSKGDKGDVGPAGPVGPAGAKGAKGPKGDKGDTGESGNFASTGADLFSTVNRETVAGSLLRDLAGENVLVFGDTDYITDEGSVLIPTSGLYMVNYGASSNNLAALELFNYKSNSVVNGTLIVTSTTQELVSHSVIRRFDQGDRIALYCPSSPGIALATSPLSVSGSPITAYLTITLVKSDS